MLMGGAADNRVVAAASPGMPSMFESIDLAVGKIHRSRSPPAHRWAHRATPATDKTVRPVISVTSPGQQAGSRGQNAHTGRLAGLTPPPRYPAGYLPGQSSMITKTFAHHSDKRSSPGEKVFAIIQVQLGFSMGQIPKSRSLIP